MWRTFPESLNNPEPRAYYQARRAQDEFEMFPEDPAHSNQESKYFGQVPGEETRRVLIKRFLSLSFFWYGPSYEVENDMPSIFQGNMYGTVVKFAVKDIQSEGRYVRNNQINKSAIPLAM
jgi:hypothetical protein